MEKGHQALKRFLKGLLDVPPEKPKLMLKMCTSLERPIFAAHTEGIEI